MQIRINNSLSQIVEFPDVGLPALMSLFTYTNKSVSYMYYQTLKQKRLKISWWMKKFYLSEEEAFQRYQDELSDLEHRKTVCLITSLNGVVQFPTGLLSKVLEFLKKTYSNFDQIKIVDLRVKPESKHPFGVKSDLAVLRPYQEEIVQTCMDKCQGTIEAATGSGKSLCIMEVVRRLGLKSLIIVPNVSILNQMHERFSKYFGSKMVGQFGDSKKSVDRDITIACADSVTESDPEIWNNIKMLAVDEEHHLSAPTVESIAYRVVPDAFYRLNFSGTAYRSDGTDLALEGAGFPIIYKYTIQQGIKDGYLAQPFFMMFRIGSTSHYSGDKILNAYKGHIMKNNILNKLVIKQVNTFVAAGKKVLILVKEKFHGNILQQSIPGAVFVRNRESVTDDRYIAPYVDSEKTIIAFNKGEIPCLIGTSIIGEGTDIIPVDVLFLLTGGLSKVATLQSIGRGMRKCSGKDTVLIFDYIHTGHRLLEKHSLARMGYYKKIGDITEFYVDKFGEVTNKA